MTHAFINAMNDGTEWNVELDVLERKQVDMIQKFAPSRASGKTTRWSM
jgi:hypothetical protein